MRLSTDDWQATLEVGPAETDFHERLQVVLYRHGLSLLRQGVSVILEDGLWTTAERAEKFADARGCCARIELHVFEVDYETLWARLQRRNDQAGSADYPMTQGELRWAWSLFQPVSAQELTEVDRYAIHAGGLDQTTEG